MPVYLDFNATTPVHPKVIEAMAPYWMDEFGNAGSRTHLFGQKAKEVVENSRRQIAAFSGCEPIEVIFTSGATESNNIAILGSARHTENIQKKHLISTPIEHKAILEPLDFLASQGYEIEYAPVDSSGRVDVNSILRRVRPDTLLVSVMHVNNETGIVQPINEICDGLKKSAVIFHTDAAQGFGKDIGTLRNPRIDLISISGHKIFGPKGIGALIRRRRSSGWIPIAPLMFGGGQERGIRPGTLPVPLIAGLAKAIELCDSLNIERNIQANDIRRKFLEAIRSVRHEINGDPSYLLPHVINIYFDGVNSEALMIELKADIGMSNGSACTSTSHKASHVLRAMGMSSKRIEESVRISWGPTTQDIDWIDKLISKLKQLQRAE